MWKNCGNRESSTDTIGNAWLSKIRTIGTQDLQREDDILKNHNILTEDLKTVKTKCSQFQSQEQNLMIM